MAEGRGGGRFGRRRGRTSKLGGRLVERMGCRIRMCLGVV